MRPRRSPKTQEWNQTMRSRQTVGNSSLTSSILILVNKKMYLNFQLRKFSSSPPSFRFPYGSMSEKNLVTGLGVQSDQRGLCGQHGRGHSHTRSGKWKTKNLKIRKQYEGCESERLPSSKKWFLTKRSALSSGRKSFQGEKKSFFISCWISAICENLQ